MNNTCLLCLAATAGTNFSQDLFIKIIIIIFFIKNLKIIQIAGSVVRLLTNIPHCCASRPGIFSDPL
jgi:hypothetical protein